MLGMNFVADTKINYTYNLPANNYQVVPQNTYWINWYPVPYPVYPYPYPIYPVAPMPYYTWTVQSGPKIAELEKRVEELERKLVKRGK